MDLNTFTNIAKALSDTNRLRALIALRNGELCACQIIDLLKLAPSTISSHMSILKQAGLVESRKDSRWVHYRLPDTGRGHKDALQIINLAVSLLSSDDAIERDNRKTKTIMKQAENGHCKTSGGES